MSPRAGDRSRHSGVVVNVRAMEVRDVEVRGSLRANMVGDRGLKLEYLSNEEQSCTESLREDEAQRQC
jgi:hypothetical protein